MLIIGTTHGRLSSSYLLEKLEKKTCFTEGGYSCVFPFKDGGIKYKRCIDGSNAIRSGSWCAYEINADFTHKEWDWCIETNCSEE